MQEKARIHLDFVAKLYSIQVTNNRYFVHEHPTSATSWYVDSIKQIGEAPTVLKAHAHLCAYGLTAKDKQGEAPALNQTRSSRTVCVCVPPPRIGPSLSWT